MWRISDFAGPPLQQANALFDALGAVFDFSFYAFLGVFGRILAEFFEKKNATNRCFKHSKSDF
jgi:hypothetical protein